MPTTLARNGAGVSERIEVDLPPHVVAVIDGYRAAHRLSRPAVIKQLLNDWCEKKHREAVCIARVAGINPESAGEDRD